MRRFLFLFFAGVLSFNSFSLQAQRNEIDTLNKKLSIATNDKERFNVLIAMARSTGRTEPTKAIPYVWRALMLPSANPGKKEEANALNLIAGLYNSSSSYDSSYTFYTRSRKLSQDFPDEMEQLCLGLAEIFIRKASYDSAEFYINKGLEQCKKSGDKLSEAGFYNCRGNLLLEQNKLNDALSQFISSARLYDSIPGQRDGLSKALVNIGNVENILGHYDKALEYTNRSLTLWLETKDDLKVAYCYKLLGRIYRRKTEHSKAIEQYRLALAIYKNANLFHELSETHQGIGNIYYDTNNFTEALREYSESLKIARSIADENQMAYVYTSIASAWFETKNFTKSIAYFDSALLKARQVHNRYLIMDSYQILSFVYEEQNNNKQALKYLKAYTELKDSLVDEENRKTLVETEARYQNKKNQADIELLLKDKELNATQLRQSRTLLYSVIAGGLLLIAIATLLFNRYRLIANTRRVLEIEKVRQHIGRDLHDDIGSTLSTIHIISDFAVHENKPENYVRHFQQISEQSSKMLETMSDMVWSINPANDSIENMLVRMREFCTEILEPRGIDYIFEGDDALIKATLSLEERKNIFLIFKESINNAAKYSGASLIKIEFERMKNALRFSVRDNGKGFDESAVRAGNGLKNMKTRAQDIGALYTMETSPGKGTLLSITLTT